MHCASLGEFEQGRPLLEEAKKNYPGYRVAVSFFSPSGYEVRKDYAGADLVFYLPIDSRSNAARLVTLLDPALVLWVKYEFWYYYLHELKSRNIPVLLVSGIFRGDQPFFTWYGNIWRKMLACFSHLFIQNDDSIRLLHSIGIHENIETAGDTRFDRVISIASQLRRVQHIDSFIDGKQVLVAGSTWEEDEIELLHFVKSRPDIRFIIAPHEVTTANIQDVKKEFHGAVLYSELGGERSVTGNVLIIDNVGMLSRLYQYATVSFVGGGFGGDGVHNVLEAAVYGKPVVFGPVYEKFDEARGLVESGGGFSVSNPVELDKLLNKLFDNRDLSITSGQAAADFVYGHRGATQKILAYIEMNRLLIN